MCDALATPLIAVDIQRESFDVGKAYSDFKANINACGAIVQFVGVVRGDMVAGQSVDYLELEHYPGMTETSVRNICAQASVRWDLLGVSVVHRVGRLLVGEDIVLIQVASAHRQESIEAVAFIMDYLKNDVPLWKKQSVAGVEMWVEQKASDKSRKKLWQ